MDDRIRPGAAAGQSGRPPAQAQAQEMAPGVRAGPVDWVERLQPTRRVSTYRLAHLLLYEFWRTGNGRLCSPTFRPRPRVCLPDQNGMP